MPSGLATTNIRAGLRPISTNINSPTMISRPSLSGHSVYLVPRSNLNNIQPASQPNLHVRTLTNPQTIAQGNGVTTVPAPTRSFPSTLSVATPAASDPPVGKFLKQILELSQKTTPTGTQDTVIRLIQRLIDDEIDCDIFCTQLCASLKSVNKRTDVESLLKNNIVQLRKDLAAGVYSLPNITPPTRLTTPTSSTTVFVTPVTIINSVSSGSQILPRPSDGLPINATFQLTPTTAVSLTPAIPRPTNPLVQSSIFSPRPVPNSIAPSTPQPIRPQLKPVQPSPIRMKTPGSPALFQPASAAAAPTLIPHRGSLLTGPTTVRSIYPGTPASVTSVISPVHTIAPIVSVPGISTVGSVVTGGTTSATASNQMNQPFFPVSQIRSYLASTLPPSSVALLSDEAINCMAHGLEFFLRDILSRVSLVAGHKAVKLSEDPHLKQVDYTREQLNYLQRLGEHDKQKQSEMEKEYILKAAKSRTRSENPVQARIREMAHQLKNEQYERERQQQANRTALNAIGIPANRRSRPSLNPPIGDQGLSTGAGITATTTDPSLSAVPSPTTPRLSLINSSASRLRLVQSSSATPPTSTGILSSGQPPTAPRYTLAASLRTRRAGLRELQVVLSKDSRLCRSRAFFRSHWR